MLLLFLPGCDDFAQAAAKNELRALNAVADCQVSILHTTLACLFYKCGHCIQAQAICPIAGQPSLVLGTADGLDTYVNKRADLLSPGRPISVLAQELNLENHTVEANITKERFETPIAVDCEVHSSSVDGRLYLIDTARLFTALPIIPTGPHP